MKVVKNLDKYFCKIKISSRHKLKNGALVTPIPDQLATLAFPFRIQAPCGSPEQLWCSNSNRDESDNGTCMAGLDVYVEGILPKWPYLSCVSMAGRAFLAG